MRLSSTQKTSLKNKKAPFYDVFTKRKHKKNATAMIAATKTVKYF